MMEIPKVLYLFNNSNISNNSFIIND